MSADLDWSSFIEVPGFTARWQEIGCTDSDLRDLQLMLLESPRGWPVVSKAGGWRKARFSPKSFGKGKSGGLRVYYAELPEFGIVLLGTAFTKSELSEVSAKGKATLARFLAAFIQRKREKRNAQG
jgi:hypothetical protein